MRRRRRDKRREHRLRALAVELRDVGGAERFPARDVVHRAVVPLAHEHGRGRGGAVVARHVRDPAIARARTFTWQRTAAGVLAAYQDAVAGSR